MTKDKSNPTVVAEGPAEVKTEPATCNHINRHSYGIDGKLDNLSCTLPKGHAGDHGALHKECTYSAVLAKADSKSNARPTGQEHIEEREAYAYWSDAAGTPADQIKPPPEIISTTPLADEDFGPTLAKRVIGL